MMARQYLLPEKGNFYKANLHVHSTYSDGKLTPEQLKQLYKSHGYSVLAYTDHNTLHNFKELDDPGFLALCGYEVDVSGRKMPGGFAKTCHLNAIAKDPEKAVLIQKPAAYNVDTINKTIRQLAAAGFLVHYNHPGWSAEEAGDYLGLEGLNAMEIYNHGCEVLTDDGDARLHYDIMLKHGMKLWCIATDDNHNPEHQADTLTDTDACGGFTMLKAPALDYASIIGALERGEFYCSTGPLIERFYIEDGKICIDCSPVKGIYLKSSRIGASAALTSPSDDLTHAEFPLDAPGTAGEPFLRFEIVTSMGKRAYTNPYFITR